MKTNNESRLNGIGDANSRRSKWKALALTVLLATTFGTVLEAQTTNMSALLAKYNNYNYPDPVPDNPPRTRGNRSSQRTLPGSGPGHGNGHGNDQCADFFLKVLVP